MADVCSSPSGQRLTAHFGFPKEPVYWVRHLSVSIHTKLLSIQREPRKRKRKTVAISSHCFALVCRMVCKTLYWSVVSMLSLRQCLEPDRSKTHCRIYNVSHPETVWPLQTNCSQFALNFLGVSYNSQDPRSHLSSRQTEMVYYQHSHTCHNHLESYGYIILRLVVLETSKSHLRNKKTEYKIEEPFVTSWLLAGEARPVALPHSDRPTATFVFWFCFSFRDGDLVT